jgi:hypothetical protein
MDFKQIADRNKFIGEFNITFKIKLNSINKTINCNYHELISGNAFNDIPDIEIFKDEIDFIKINNSMFLNPDLNLKF